MSNFRPTRFDDLIGQEHIIKALSISVKSARKRNDALNHCLFSGPQGLGKTTLANALANELDVSIQVANGANLRSIKNAIPYVMRIEERSIFFIDEIHRATPTVHEFLYPIMEDFKLDTSSEPDKDNELGSVVSIPIPKFTLVGATTESGSLPAPFLDRFKLKFTLELYRGRELVELLRKNSEKIKVRIDNSGLIALAKASRGTPRIANGMLEWVRDYSIAESIRNVSQRHVGAALSMRGIGPDGLTDQDRKYLNFLKKSNGPVGLSTIVSGINVDRDTVENMIEPFLIRKNLINKTPKGRVLV